MKKIKNKIFSGACILGFGTFISKIIGAIFRIPLTALVGTKGLGLYQLVFPVYTVMLDFSGAGAPTALSKIIASYQGQDKEKYAQDFLAVSIRVLSIIGLFFSIIMAIFSYPLSKLQGNVDAYLSYIFLSPSVFFVCLISSYRGYFQGLMNMKPTAISQIVEQLIKLFCGLFFAFIFIPNIKRAIAGTLFAVTLSEIAAFLLLYFIYRKRRSRFYVKYKFSKNDFFCKSKHLIKILIPVAIIGICLPFSQLLDSFIVVNILSKYLDNATSLFGLLTGVCLTIINLPVSLCYGISVVAVPSVSSAKTHREKLSNCFKSLFLTLLFSIPFALIILFFPNQIINILFSKLSLSEKVVGVNLLKILSPCVVLLSVLQTLNASLIGMGKLYTPVFSMSIAIVFKVVISVVLLNIQSINIYGGAIALIACYFIADLINFILITSKAVKNERKVACNRQFAS